MTFHEEKRFPVPSPYQQLSQINLSVSCALNTLREALGLNILSSTLQQGRIDFNTDNPLRTDTLKLNFFLALNVTNANVKDPCFQRKKRGTAQSQEE